MRRCLMPLVGLILLGPALPGLSLGQPAPEPKDIPELKVLERWVGKWDLHVTMKKSVWFPKGETIEATAITEWALGGRYLQSKNKDKTTPYQGTWLATYDLAHKAYRQWYFDSLGGAVEVSGEWDEKSKTMTWTGQDKKQGLTTKTQHKFLSADEHEWTSVVTDKDGQVMMDEHGKAKRQK